MWILIAVCAIFVYWGMSTASLHLFVRGVGERISFRYAVKVTMIGCYYLSLIHI